MRSALFVVFGLVTAAAFAQTVPSLQVTPQPYAQAAIERDGQEIARYHFGDTLRRPFLYPVIGPAGRSLTRMGHPHDPVTHSHHNSVWISHQDVNGISFWADNGQGKIAHVKTLQYDDGPDAAVIDVENVWLGPDKKQILKERRRQEFIAQPNKQWLLVIDLLLQPASDEFTFGKTPFGLVGVRMAKSIGVKDGGGQIRNSAGGLNEKEILWKQATWVDYSGPITNDHQEGITLFDHPQNPNHPTYFHVREDGWMGTSLTYDAPRILKPGESLRLRYGLWIHAGVPTADEINGQYQAFRKRTFAEVNMAAKP